MTDYHQHQCKRKESKTRRLFDTDDTFHTGEFGKKTNLKSRYNEIGGIIHIVHVVIILENSIGNDET